MTLMTPDLPQDMRVLQVLPALGDGGVEQSALEMATFLHARGTPKGVAQGVASAGGSKVAILDALGVPHHRMALNRKMPWAVLWHAVRLRRLIRREGFTLVHARSRGPAWSAWLATRGLRVAGRPVTFLTTFHGTYGAGSALKRWYNRVMLRGPVTIANSEFIRQHIVTVYGVAADRLVVAPRGIDPAVYTPTRYQTGATALRRELSLNDTSGPVVIAVGRLARWKGQHVLIEALDLLQQQAPDLPWTCLIVGAPDGTGSYAAELEARVAAAGLQNRIRLPGSRKDIPALLSVSDIAVSTSVRAEAFGRVAVEAQAMGVPVIATALGGSLETVRDGETGYLIAPNAPQALAEKLHLLLTAPELRRRLGQDALQWAALNFTVERCCTKEAEGYQRAWQAMNGV